MTDDICFTTPDYSEHKRLLFGNIPKKGEYSTINSLELINDVLLKEAEQRMRNDFVEEFDASLDSMTYKIDRYIDRQLNLEHSALYENKIKRVNFMLRKIGEPNYHI